MSLVERASLSERARQAAHYASVRARLRNPPPRVKVIPIQQHIEVTAIPIVAPRVEERQAEEPSPKPRYPTFKSVLDATCEEFGVRQIDVYADRRHKPVARARHVVMYLMYEITEHSFPRIGRFMRRDHTSIMHGHQKITRLLQENEKLRGHVEAIKARVKI